MSRKVVGTLSAAESRKIVVADLIPDDEVAKTALYALMDEVAAFMFAARNAEKPATRHDLYARFISGSGDTAVERGVFAPAASPKVAFALKAYIDLAYTTNLSDALDRYYLAAPGLPGRSVLNDAFMRNSHHAETFEKLASETVLERLAASTFDLPHYADLELSDVRAIRHSASWAAFNVSVKAYLERPFDAGRLGTLAEAHRYMLEGLTKHVRERRNDLRVRRVEAVTGVMIEVAGRGILLASCDAAIWHALLHSVFSTVRKVVKGYAVRVVFAFIDPITRRLDTNLTTSVEVARSKAEIAVEQVRELLRGLSEGSSVRMAELDADVAEAGKH